MTAIASRKLAYGIMALAGMGGVLYGYDIGVIAGALLFINKAIPMSDNQTSFLVAAVLGGGAFATLISGPLADWLGRRTMIIAASIIFLFGVFGVSFAHSYEMLLFGRLTQGIAVGMVAIAIPLYLAELLPADIRGRGVSAFQLMLTAGILLANLISLEFTLSGNWRGMFLSAAVPGLVLFVGALFLPNSPRWLCLKGQPQAALKVLELTRSKAEAALEFQAMQAVLTQSGLNQMGSLWQRRYILPLAIVFSIAILGQLTGINSWLQFSAIILKNAGLDSNLAAMMGSSAITGLNFVVTIVAFFLIDKVGRKFLLCVGTAGVALSLFYSGSIFFLMSPGLEKGYLLLAGILGFILFFAIGPGVVVWLVLSELLPSRIRSTGMAVGLFLNSLASTMLAAVFMALVHYIGFGGVFWFCGACSLFYFLIAFLAMPEAKNKTLEQIESHFAQAK